MGEPPGDKPPPARPPQAVHTAACAVLDYSNSWGYAEGSGQGQEQRRCLAGWKAGEAAEGSLELADAAERLAELVGGARRGGTCSAQGCVAAPLC